MRYVFNEVLNDCIDYFFLADAGTLLAFSQGQGVGSDLEAAFTQTDAAGTRKRDPGV